MKRLFLLAVLLLLLIPGALSEESAGVLLDKAGFAELEALSEALDGPNVREIAGMALSGKLPVSRDIPAQALRRLFAGLSGAEAFRRLAGETDSGFSTDAELVQDIMYFFAPYKDPQLCQHHISRAGERVRDRQL